MRHANTDHTPATDCPACDGHGYVFSVMAQSAHDPRGTVPCKACKGSGERHPARR